MTIVCAQLYQLLGQYLLSLNLNAPAERALNTAASCFGDEGVPRSSRLTQALLEGRLYYNVGDLERAAGRLVAATDMDKKCAEAHELLSLIAERRGDAAGARRECELAVGSWDTLFSEAAAAAVAGGRAAVVTGAAGARLLTRLGRLYLAQSIGMVRVPCGTRCCA